LNKIEDLSGGISMRLFLYTRVGSYHEETYSIVAGSEEEAQEIVDSYTDFEISPDSLKRTEVKEIDLNKKGMEYVNSYSE
jgi:hypothetical protein